MHESETHQKGAFGTNLMIIYKLIFCATILNSLSETRVTDDIEDVEITIENYNCIHGAILNPVLLEVF